MEEIYNNKISFNSNFIYKIFNNFLFLQFGGKNSGQEVKWESFKHNGVLFPEPYTSHNIPVIINNEKIKLEPESEEYATIYAKYIDSEYIKNKTFNKNFLNDWKQILKKSNDSNYNKIKDIKDITEIDFSLIYNYIIKTKQDKENISKEEKEKLKEIKNKQEEKYKIAYVNNKEQLVGNFRMEPPGLFLGRGCHPKAGKIKKRVYPEDIVINIGKNEKIPELPEFYKNHKWGKIIHDNTLEWLAAWKDIITGKVKYVWLGAKSDFKAKSDQSKFETARKLKKHIESIRKTNFDNLFENNDIKTRQLATALYLIDNLALRVGNEKGDDEADTVGVCSLRVEHIEFLEENKIKLDFLGKDSIRYVKVVEIIPEVYNNLRLFSKDKKKTEDLFDNINTLLLNQYLKTMMDDLTAKVFRTYNASHLFQTEIDEINKNYENYNKDDKINILIDMYNRANLKVALLCNHQKNISKSFNTQIEKIDEVITNLKQKRKELEDQNNKKNKKKINSIKNKISLLKNKKELKIELKNLSLSTSKTNYIDPRITIAFLKKHNLPIEKIFSQTLRDKFFWAMDVDNNWTF